LTNLSFIIYHSSFKQRSCVQPFQKPILLNHLTKILMFVLSKMYIGGVLSGSTYFIQIIFKIYLDCSPNKLLHQKDRSINYETV